MWHRANILVDFNLSARRGRTTRKMKTYAKTCFGPRGCQASHPNWPEKPGKNTEYRTANLSHLLGHLTRTSRSGPVKMGGGKWQPVSLNRYWLFHFPLCLLVFSSDIQSVPSSVFLLNFFSQNLQKNESSGSWIFNWSPSLSKVKIKGKIRRLEKCTFCTVPMEKLLKLNFTNFVNSCYCPLHFLGGQAFFPKGGIQELWKNTM